MSTLTADSTPVVLPRTLSSLNPLVVDDLKRFGKKSDGGYLLPASAMNRIDGVISFGVSDDWSFEEDIRRLRPDLPIHAYDHTVGEAAFRRKIAATRRDIIWEILRTALFRSTSAEVSALIQRRREQQATYSAYKRFFSGSALHCEKRVFNRHEKNIDITVDEVFGRLGDKSNLLLKIDIEGAEYRVMSQILEHSESIDLMVVEFHDTEPLRNVFLKHIEEILARFEIVHVHGNNWAGTADDGLPDVLEISFLNKKLAQGLRHRRNRLPIEGLDFANDPRKSDLTLAWPDLSLSHSDATEHQRAAAG